jgi:hypothetical protein
MKYVHYFYGYIVFLAGIVSWESISYYLHGPGDFGFSDTVVISVLVGIVPYVLGLILLWFAQIRYKALGLTNPSMYFFAWAFLLALALELMPNILNLLPTGNTPLGLVAEILFPPIFVAGIYVFIKNILYARERRNGDT